ncbi:hypothetical protein AMTR_s04542p00007540, partial [Amborella trichopoda]
GKSESGQHKRCCQNFARPIFSISKLPPAGQRRTGRLSVLAAPKQGVLLTMGGKDQMTLGLSDGGDAWKRVK